MQTCPDCGERVYKLGCVNCDEAMYIAQQEAENDRLQAEAEQEAEARSKAEADAEAPR